MANKNSYTYFILTPDQVTDVCVKDMNHLLNQLTDHSKGVDKDKIISVIEHDGIIFCAKDNKTGNIIAMGSLIISTKLVWDEGRIDDVVVDEQHRRRGIAEEITKCMIAEGRKKGLERIELTSRHTRIAANKLYQKTGFTIQDVNVYRMKP